MCRCSFKVIICGGLAENLLTIGVISNGDQVGAEGGVISHLIMGPFRNLLGSFKVFVGGIPCTRMLDLAGQNGLLPNAPLGITLTPTQTQRVVAQLMRAPYRTVTRYFMLLAACILLLSCSSVSKLLPWHKPTTNVASIRVAAPPGANLNSATALDLVFVYNTPNVAMLPSTAPEWFAQKASLQSGLAQGIDVVSLQVPPATVIDPVALPKRYGKAVAVFAFANYLSKDGQARSDVTAFKHAVIWLPQPKFP